MKLQPDLAPCATKASFDVSLHVPNDEDLGGSYAGTRHGEKSLGGLSRLSEEVSKNTKLARIYSRTTSNRCVGQQIPSGIILERNQVAHDKPAHLKNEREK